MGTLTWVCTHMAREPNVRLLKDSSACSCASATASTSVVFALPPNDSCEAPVPTQSKETRSRTTTSKFSAVLAMGARKMLL